MTDKSSAPRTRAWPVSRRQLFSIGAWPPPRSASPPAARARLPASSAGGASVSRRDADHGHRLHAGHPGPGRHRARPHPADQHGDVRPAGLVAAGRQGRQRVRPRPGRELHGVARRVGVHLQAPQGRDLPRRHEVRRERGQGHLRPHRRPGDQVQERARRARAVQGDQDPGPVHGRRSCSPRPTRLPAPAGGRQLRHLLAGRAEEVRPDRLRQPPGRQRARSCSPATRRAASSPWSRTRRTSGGLPPSARSRRCSTSWSSASSPTTAAATTPSSRASCRSR